MGILHHSDGRQFQFFPHFGGDRLLGHKEIRHGAGKMRPLNPPNRASL
jgi:hypothetical protein